MDENKYRIDWQTGTAYKFDSKLYAYVFFKKFNPDEYENEEQLINDLNGEDYA